MTTDDIYDAMVMCFLRACRRYDPLYTDKVRQVCEVLDGETFCQQFTADAVHQLWVLTLLGALGCWFASSTWSRCRQPEEGYRLSKGAVLATSASIL